jgi:hypothetical protein
MTPTRCPNPDCLHSDADPAESGAAPFYWCKGTFRRHDLRAVRRYQCKECGRHFSEQTFSETWRRRRGDVDEPLRRLLERGISLRSAARLLGVNRKTVGRRARDPRFRAAGDRAACRSVSDRAAPGPGTSAAAPGARRRSSGARGRT